ncbi:Adaptor protein complex, sigma subunit like protein [Aduncisulcus paluster]|uniref:AP complex subunit sigma n=1 Tax=Aduncisulcus paluster TaxID=2918883 RepID=A0ABQ5JUK6_9EUKA|nr:Adaptor protein complex, sigma subunit like protein [Aduncisulcus paluster]
MIEAVIVVNNHGLPRLLRFYEDYTTAEQQKVMGRVYEILTKRKDTSCNFLSGDVGLKNPNTRVIFRHYATLYFAFVIDESESPLAIMDLIHIYVEALDLAFQSVCELDLIFNADKANFILDEVLCGGLEAETDIKQVTSVYEAMNLHEKGKG